MVPPAADEAIVGSAAVANVCPVVERVDSGAQGDMTTRDSTS